MEKKSKELDCLRQAVTLGLRKRGRTKTFFKAVEAGLKDKESILDGERPDFVILTPQEQNGKRTLLGIEHFRVDHLVTQKQYKKGNDSKQVASIGIVEQKNVNAFYDKYNEKVMASPEIPDGLFDGIAKLVENMANNIQSATYRNFMESFVYSMERHLSNVDDYLQELNKKSTGKYNIQMGFLVEVHSDFGHLYLSHDGKTEKAKNGLMPFFEEIVQWIEENCDARKVNFIVFYLSETLEKGIHEVVYVPTKNFRANLQRQRQKIFSYVGDDMDLEPFELNHKESVAHVVCREEDEEKFSVELSVKETPRDDKMKRFLLSSKCALECEETSKDYALTGGTLFTMTLLRDNVKRWRKSCIEGEKWFYPIVIDGSPTFLKKRAEEYMMRWGDEVEE